MQTREPTGSPATATIMRSAGILDSYRNLLEQDARHLAVLDDRGHAMTRAQLWHRASEIQAEMSSRGLFSGDVVIVCLPNWAEWPAVYLAAIHQDLVPATLPVTTDPESIAYTAGLVGAKAIVLPREHRGRNFAAETSRIAEQLGHYVDMVLVDGTDGDRTWLTFDGPEVAVPEYPAGLAHILFSSSTTGKSKAIAHSESSLTAYNRGVIDRYGITDEQPIFMPSPLGHSTGFWHGVRMSILTGASLVLQDRWDPRRALELVDEHRCAITVAATPFLKDLVDAEWLGPTHKLNGMRVFLCGGAPVPPSLIEEAQHQMPGTRIGSIWAMSEGGATSSLPDDTPDVVAHGCGRVLPGVTLETITASDAIAPRGTEGEIAMRTPSQCLGYIGQDDLYRSAFTADGYFRTGDVGIVDEAGYLQITGRVKDLIIRGGVNISPVEIENSLASHDRIARVAVVGRPDDRLGERICAVIQPHGEAPTFDELIGWLDGRGVPRRLWPESIHIVANMPQTPAGKIRKNELRQLLPEKAVSEKTPPATAPSGDNHAK